MFRLDLLDHGWCAAPARREGKGVTGVEARLCLMEAGFQRPRLFSPGFNRSTRGAASAGVRSRWARRRHGRGAGYSVAIGAHGRRAGIGPRWELWSFVRGGVTPVEALRAGTIVSAQSLGMARDIGSLEVGKLADLVVLDADPTRDIRNSEKVHRVMIGGTMYDPSTLDEVGTGTWEAHILLVGNGRGIELEIGSAEHLAAAVRLL